MNPLSLRRSPPRAPVLWAFALLGLTRCIFDDRTAGTSTTITNPSPTVFGAAILRNGLPAKGARVELRAVEYELGPGGAPRSKVVSSGTVDDTGGFSLPMPPLMKEHYLEFTEVPGAGVDLPEDSVELQLRRWPDGLPRSGHLATFRLALPGGVAGRFGSLDTTVDSTRWVGVRGTGNFSKVAKNGSFFLARIAPGTHHLVLIANGVTDSVPGAKPGRVRDFVATFTVEAGKTTDAGVVFFPDS